MNWDAIGAIADSAAAIGVVASLVYLALQIRLNSKHIEASMYQAANDVFVNWYALLANNSRLAAIWYEQVLRGNVRSEDENQARAVLTMFFLALENNYQHEKRGLVTRNTLALPGLRGLFSRPFVLTWLEKEGKFNLTSEFLIKVHSIRVGTQDAA